ncbi:hypothetical protein L1887_14046 [Cichorium endivia]|nr:hypothetical protein L1887_14046 [Cichorium endivia]
MVLSLNRTALICSVEYISKCCLRLHVGATIMCSLSQVAPYERPALSKAYLFPEVGMAVGGQDLICVKQKPSSTIPPSELRGYLDDLGDSLFSNGRSPSLIEMKTRDDKQKIPDVFNRMLQPHTMQFINITKTSSKDGLTVIECKRGRDVFSESHSKWLQTVGTNPEAMVFKMAPNSGY